MLSCVHLCVSVDAAIKYCNELDVEAKVQRVRSTVLICCTYLLVASLTCVSLDTFFFDIALRSATQGNMHIGAVDGFGGRST